MGVTNASWLPPSDLTTSSYRFNRTLEKIRIIKISLLEAILLGLYLLLVLNKKGTWL
jgi:hypothetical protein